METLAKRFFISGRVQGVGFRYFVERVAARLGISGYARNRFDGSVEVYAIGSVSQLDTLRDELNRGPRMAAVQDVREESPEIQPEYSHGFTIENDN